MQISITQIINELNESNSSNYKLDVLKKYKDHLLLQRVLKMALDKVQYNFVVGKKSLEKLFEMTMVWDNSKFMSLEDALDILENEFCTRKVTGNAALDRLYSIFTNISMDDNEIITKIINRDLKINVGKTQINKVFKDLITKPVYMRCDTYSDKTAKNIKFPAMVQLKADGTFREFTVTDGDVFCRSRSGEEYEYPIIFESMRLFPDGVYTGELTIEGIYNRAESNGLINSDNPPHDKIILELWDYITPEEYQNASKKIKNKTPYEKRFLSLLDIIKETKNVKIIPYVYVKNIQEALKQTSIWMTQGFEGSILKDLNGVYRDGTSKEQLKLKLEISVEMRCVGFLDGTKGTKREGKVGSIIFENDEGSIKGRCSGFSDIELDNFTENKDFYIGKILEVQFNDLTKGTGNDYYSLSHPRFIEWRNDKNETDSLEKVFKIRDAAMLLESKI
jgi:DNA ligase-1